MRSDLIDVHGLKHAETAKAILFSDTGTEKDAVWLPKSQVEYVNDGRESFVTVTMPEWLAKEKGFI